MMWKVNSMHFGMTQQLHRVRLADTNLKEPPSRIMIRVLAGLLSTACEALSQTRVVSIEIS